MRREGPIQASNYAPTGGSEAAKPLASGDHARPFEARNRHFDRLFNTPGLMWLGQNTNHFHPHPDVVQAMLDSIRNEEYHAYAPPAGFEELRALILEDLGLRDQSVLVTDGAVEALYNVCHTLCGPGDEFVTTDPGWKWPIDFARAAGARTIEIPIYEPEHGYRLTVAQLEAAVTSKTRLVYLVDPNNPLGVCYSATEIEAVVLTHKAVAEAAVVPLPDPTLGAVPVVYVVLRPGRSCSERELREFCAQHLSRHKVPRAIHFVEELYKTPSGKIQKHRLKEAYS